MKLSEIPDSILADMIRNGCYTKGESIGAEPEDNQYLLVFAVPYGNPDGVETLKDALNAFRDLMADGDWEERNIQVLTVESSGVAVHEVSAEVLEG
jgi:hypothetical protein